MVLEPSYKSKTKLRRGMPLHSFAYRGIGVLYGIGVTAVFALRLAMPEEILAIGWPTIEHSSGAKRFWLASLARKMVPRGINRHNCDRAAFNQHLQLFFDLFTESDLLFYLCEMVQRHLAVPNDLGHKEAGPDKPAEAIKSR